MTHIKKIIVVLVALATVSICGDEKKAVEFIKHLTEHSKDGNGSVEYWSETVTKVAKDHEDEAKALRKETKISAEFMEELKKKLGPGAKGMAPY